MELPSIFDLKGRIAFVSGAGGHLGQTMVRALGAAGAHLIVNGRDDEKLAALERQLRSEGHSVERAAFDVGDIAAVRAFFGGLKRLDILVNNAVAMEVKSFQALQPSDFAETYQSAVTAAFEAARAGLPALQQAVAEAGEASIVNIASMYGHVSPDASLYDSRDQQSPFHYGPAKAGLLQLTRHLAAEFGAKRIRVNALVPGPFPAKAPPELTRRLSGRTMLGRVGRPEEIAGPLLFLASPASSYMTGAALDLDGGWTAW
ncbi:MAG TPA: SDR family oxidoreductase [Rhizomicrobium sp.]|jgi:NAD(P)-dependent dehydrogenase (short-subunit alcohol dehydrogenase family)|nr:SDR family oxidoreductase [Rhizomicrobium sp.]